MSFRLELRAFGLLAHAVFSHAERLERYPHQLCAVYSVHRSVPNARLVWSGAVPSSCALGDSDVVSRYRSVLFVYCFLHMQLSFLLFGCIR